MRFHCPTTRGIDMSSPILPKIDAEQVAFMRSGVSISVGSCGPGNRPSVTRGIGCRVSEDRRRVTVFVSASQAETLLADIRGNGAIAVVFSLPSTHRTIQLKGKDTMVEPLLAGDLPIVEAYRDAFVEVLENFGYDPRLIRTFLACAPDDIVGLCFTPNAAFTQTPGPNAGEPLTTGA